MGLRPLTRAAVAAAPSPRKALQPRESANPMSIPFKTPAQQLVYERARQGLAALPGVSLARHETEPSLRVSRDSAQLHVYVLPFGELDAMIRVGTLVASNAKPDAAPLLRYLLEQNSINPIGAFSLDKEGHVLLEHAVVASSFDPPGLQATIEALFKILAQHQGLIVGFIQRTAELAAQAAAAGEQAPAPAAPAPAPAALAPAPAAPAPQQKPAQAAAPAPAPAARPATKPTPDQLPTRIWLDDMGLYHCIRGLPIAVLDLLDLLDAGQSDTQIMAQFPDINSADLNEVRIFGPGIRAASLADQAAHTPPPPEPEPAPAPKKSSTSLPKHPRRLKLDALGLFYCVRDLPISVDEILDLLDAGKDDKSIHRDYPDLTPEDLEEIKHFGPSLRQPKAAPAAATPEPAPVVQIKKVPLPEPTEAPVARLQAPAPRKRTLKRIRMDDLSIYYCIRGLPISVDEIIERLDAGKSEAQILAEYKALEPEDIEEVIWYRDRMRAQ